MNRKKALRFWAHLKKAWYRVSRQVLNSVLDNIPTDLFKYLYLDTFFREYLKSICIYLDTFS